MRSVILVIVSAVLYFLAARLGFYLAFSHTVIVPVWASAGVAVALMVRYSQWPVAVGIFIGSVLTSLNTSWTEDLSLPVELSMYLIVSTGRTLEALVAWRLIRSWIPNEIYSSQRSVFRFFFISMVISLIGGWHYDPWLPGIPN